MGDVSSTENKRIIYFAPGTEYKIRIEEREEFKTSVFSTIYSRAATHLKQIIMYNINMKPRSEENMFEFNNNIIAFTGERGSGKSSAMVSFMEAITQETNFEEKENLHFEDVGVIDPSMFEDSDKILEIVVAKMFSKFKDRLDDRNCDIDAESKRRLLEVFNRVYENLKCIQKDGKERLEEEHIEALAKLASGSNLKDSMEELVEQYLEFMGKKYKKSKFFLLVIDDFDLNIKHASVMAEQIRKYLMIPKVIILMALKIDQLSSVIEKERFVDFEKMIKENRISSDEPQSMAHRYLEKLIPEDRRLYLPALRDPENKNIRISFSEKKEVHFPVEEVILKLIYQKTGLIFLKGDYEANFFIPDSLREFHSLYLMLNNLENINITDLNENDFEKKKVAANNLRRFEDYFYNTWVKTKLSSKYIETIEAFRSIDYRRKNRYIVQIVEKLKEENEWNLDDLGYDQNSSKEFKCIVEKINNPLNISLGDVLFVLRILSIADETTEETRRFLFAVKTIYSIMFFNFLFIEKDFNSAQILIGGSVYNIVDVVLIRRESKTKRRRDHFQIDYFPKVTSKLYSIDVNEKKFIEWLHYFLLFVGMKDPINYRKYKEPYYVRETNRGANSKQARGVDYATFDLLAFIFFILNPEKVYEKSGLEIEELKKDKNSIYSELSEKRREFRTFLQIYNMEFLDRIIRSDFKELKEDSGDEYYKYFNDFFIEFKNSIKNIIEKDSYLEGKKIHEDISALPIISFASNMNDVQKQILNDLFKDTPSQEKIKKIMDIINTMIDTIEKVEKNLINQVYNEKVVIIKIKNEIDSFNKEIDDGGFDELKKVGKFLSEEKKNLKSNTKADDLKKSIIKIKSDLYKGREYLEHELRTLLEELEKAVALSQEANVQPPEAKAQSQEVSATDAQPKA